MAPVRRYLRISANAVLEVRIYVDNPADAHRWLLHSSDPALPRIIEAVRPLVLPKLREENARTKKGSKKKSVKDVVHGEDFEVSIFLTELSTSHSLLARTKLFSSDKRASNKQVGGTKAQPVEIAADSAEGESHDDRIIPNLRREDSEGDGEGIRMTDIPLATEQDNAPRGDAISVSDSDHEDNAMAPDRKEENKKKLDFRTNYEGFRIYGRILCLVVKRKTTSSGLGKTGQAATGQAVMENWIASTQENPAMLDE